MFSTKSTIFHAARRLRKVANVIVVTGVLACLVARDTWGTDPSLPSDASQSFDIEGLLNAINETEDFPRVDPRHPDEILMDKYWNWLESQPTPPGGAVRGDNFLPPSSDDQPGTDLAGSLGVVARLVFGAAIVIHATAGTGDAAMLYPITWQCSKTPARICRYEADPKNVAFQQAFLDADADGNYKCKVSCSTRSDLTEAIPHNNSSAIQASPTHNVCLSTGADGQTAVDLTQISFQVPQCQLERDEVYDVYLETLSGPDSSRRCQELAIQNQRGIQACQAAAANLSPEEHYAECRCLVSGAQASDIQAGIIGLPVIGPVNQTGSESEAAS